MQIKKAVAALTIAACMTSCSETDISSNTEGLTYGDVDANSITFSETAKKSLKRPQQKAAKLTKFQKLRLLPPHLKQQWQKAPNTT